MNSLKIYFFVINLFLTKCFGQGVVNRFCERGYLDSAVRTNSNRIFIFFDSYLMEMNSKLEVRDSRPTPIRNTFQGLAFNKIDAAFTADGHNNPNRGKTYLISSNIIQEFSDVRPTRQQANINDWKTSRKLANVNLVINQIGDSFALFFDTSSGSGDDNLMLFFDSVTDPADLPVTKHVNTQFLIQQPLSNKGLLLKAVIPLSNGSYFVLYNPIQSNANGKYCLIEKLLRGVR